MTRSDAREALLPHAKRPIRAFLRTADEAEEEAFWDFIYDSTPDVCCEVADAAARQLLESAHTVGALLAGWRPEALSEEEVTA